MGMVSSSWFNPFEMKCNIDYGGNMGLEGNLPDLTTQPLYALENTVSMAGVGLAMEGQEGNEVLPIEIPR